MDAAGNRYEAALYGALSCNVSRMLSVCSSWEDECWVYSRAWLDLAAETEITKKQSVEQQQQQQVSHFSSVVAHGHAWVMFLLPWICMQPAQTTLACCVAWQIKSKLLICHKLLICQATHHYMWCSWCLHSHTAVDRCWHNGTPSFNHLHVLPSQAAADVSLDLSDLTDGYTHQYDQHVLAEGLSVMRGTWPTQRSAWVKSTALWFACWW